MILVVLSKGVLGAASDLPHSPRLARSPSGDSLGQVKVSKHCKRSIKLAKVLVLGWGRDAEFGPWLAWVRMEQKVAAEAASRIDSFPAKSHN